MNIPLPSRGDDILPWARSVTAGVNALAPFGGRGTLVKESANGFGFESLPENKRERKLTDSYIPPWTFKCTIGEDPDTHEETREGGWENCKIQLGYDAVITDEEIDGLDSCEDGKYYVEIDLSEDTYTLRHVALDANIPTRVMGTGVFYFSVGRVEDGVQTFAPHIVPVISTYL